MTQTNPKLAAIATGDVLGSLAPRRPDVMLGVIAAFRADPRPDKLDLGVGVFRDADGRCPVMGAVKEAERKLLAEQDTKAYLGAEGDRLFPELLRPLVFGPDADPARVRGVQTPGGTGALRLAADLVHLANPEARLWMGVPAWPNHPQIFGFARFQIETYDYFDSATQTVCFDNLIDAVARAAPGDAVLLQVSCHNPTGADLTQAQWCEVAALLAERRLLPILDLAYQGLGQGLEEDSLGVRIVAEAVPEMLLAYSCDKNFALYRERTGALFLQARDGKAADAIFSNLLALTRANYSMPPDHGAAAARIVLQSAELTAIWREELSAMRARLRGLRDTLGAAHPMLQPLATQNGLFAQLPLGEDGAEWLRRERGVYVVGSGRINVAGLTDATIPQFAEALAAWERQKELAPAA